MQVLASQNLRLPFAIEQGLLYKSDCYTLILKYTLFIAVFVCAYKMWPSILMSKQIGREGEVATVTSDAPHVLVWIVSFKIRNKSVEIES